MLFIQPSRTLRNSHQRRSLYGITAMTGCALMLAAVPASAAPLSQGASTGLAGSIVSIDAPAKLIAQCKFTAQVTGGNQMLIAYEATATAAIVAQRTTVRCFVRNRFATSDAAIGTLPGPAAAAAAVDTMPLAALSVCLSAEFEPLGGGPKTVLPQQCVVPPPIVAAAVDMLAL